MPNSKDGHFITLKQTGELVIVDDKGRELDKAFRVPYGAILRMKSGTKVKKGNILIEWDPHVMPILAEKTGKVVFKDIEIGTTMRGRRYKRCYGIHYHRAHW